MIRFCRWVTLGLLGAAAIAGCQLAPTKIYETSDLNLTPLQAGLAKPIKLTAETVVIDARAPFEYAVVHVPGSINLSWMDFSDRQGPYIGRLSPDLNREARRLATYGLSPETPVVVVGDGIGGNGEEGRLAWTLLYMGVQNVQVSDMDSLGVRYSNQNPPPRESVPVWQPQFQDSMLVDRKQFLQSLKMGTRTHFHIIDVRSKDEYFSKTKNLVYEVPDLNALNIEWKEFFTKDGRPKPSMAKELQAIGVQKTDRIFVISNRGVRSAAATYALLALGFENAANFAGGFDELLERKSMR